MAKVAVSESELLYGEILKECIKLIENTQAHEWSKITLMCQLEKQIDLLISKDTDEESVLKKLARDITKARKKLVDDKQLRECRQLYLFYDNPENIQNISGCSSRDLTSDMLIDFMKKDNNRSGKGGDIDSLLTLLEKIRKLLLKAENMIWEHPPNKDNRGTADEKVARIKEKTESISEFLRNGPSQIQHPFPF